MKTILFRLMRLNYGDNDRLAALVANLIRADLLILLTDVDGLLSSSGSVRSGEVIHQVDSITPEIIGLIEDTDNEHSRGG